MRSADLLFKHSIYPILFIEWILLYYSGVSTFNGIVLGASWLIFNLAQVCLSYKNNLMWLLVVWFFLTLYSYEPLRYFAYGMEVGFRWQVRTPWTVYNVALYSYLFNLVLGYLTSSKRSVEDGKKICPIKNAQFLLWAFCLIIGVVLMIKGKTGETILESGGYGKNNKVVSSIYGYSIIFISVAMLYSASKFRKVVTLSVAAAYILKDLIYGGRIDSVMLILMLYMIYFRYVLSKKQITLILIFGFIFNEAFGAVRGAILQRSFTDALVDKITNFSLSSGNSREVYYASMRMFYMIKVGALDAADRISSFFYFLLSSVVPYSQLPPLASLVSYKSNYYHTGGGGLMPVFVYVWGGIPGVILSALFISRIFTSYIKKNQQGFGLMYTMLVIATIPRWYAYYPIQLIKMCVYGALFFTFTEMIRENRAVPWKSKQKVVHIKA